MVGLLNPVTGVLLGALVAHETFTLEQVAGIVLVLVGILAATRRRDGAIPRTGAGVATFPEPGPAGARRSALLTPV